MSVDSSGIPKCFGTPEAKGSHEEETPKASCPPIKSFLRRRPGQAVAASSKGEKPTGLRKELGIWTRKRPASNKKKVKKAGSLTKGMSLTKGCSEKKAKATPTEPTRKPWAKLTKTVTNKEPYRAYICGAHDPDGKVMHIVQTTKAGHPSYVDIMQEILKRLQAEHLTKQEAVELKDHLYKTW